MLNVFDFIAGHSSRLGWSVIKNSLPALYIGSSFIGYGERWQKEEASMWNTLDSKLLLGFGTLLFDY